jgi:hypothetical protein
MPNDASASQQDDGDTVAGAAGSDDGATAAEAATVARLEQLLEELRGLNDMVDEAGLVAQENTRQGRRMKAILGEVKVAQQRLLAICKPAAGADGEQDTALPPAPANAAGRRPTWLSAVKPVACAVAILSWVLTAPSDDSALNGGWQPEDAGSPLLLAAEGIRAASPSSSDSAGAAAPAAPCTLPRVRLADLEAEPLTPLIIVDLQAQPGWHAQERWRKTELLRRHGSCTETETVPMRAVHAQRKRCCVLPRQAQDSSCTTSLCWTEILADCCTILVGGVELWVGNSLAMGTHQTYTLYILYMIS